MHNQNRPPFADEGTRSLLKKQYKKVYFICRLFANNYKEHQSLFSNVIAATVQSIRSSRKNEEKQTLLLRACINMAALHSLSRSIAEGERRQPGETKANEIMRWLQARAGYSPPPSSNEKERSSQDPDTDKMIQFKSPDYQKNIVKFREAVGEVSDYEKILLFMNFENVVPDEIPGLSGLSPASAGSENRKEHTKKSIIPYIKEKLIWS